MENYVTVVEWYILGMVIYFVYNLFIGRNMHYYIELIHKEVPEYPFSDNSIMWVVTIVSMLSSFVWPITAGYDFVKTLKGEID